MRATHRSALTLSIVAVAFALSPAWAVPVLELEPNDPVSLAQAVPFAGASIDVLGDTSPRLVSSFLGALSPGVVAQFGLSGQPEGRRFVSEIGSATPSDLDTILGQFVAGDLVAFNDDNPLVPDTLLSRLAGIVPVGGTLDLRVSGFGDGPDDPDGPPFGSPGFQGNHAQDGTFRLDVSLVDLDFFFAFTGLLPGSAFAAQITVADFDTLLGVFNSTGTLLTANDDCGASLLSCLTGTVPANGVVLLGVSGAPDIAFTGDNNDNFGRYTLRLSQRVAVPAPVPLTLLIVGIAVVTIVHRGLGGGVSPKGAAPVAASNE